ncbi:MAG TPA: hypothetical protein VN943_06455 [Candidatus Acidoferrum sp.]|nr:hypothetical protein [Candidatus Acidoferrum sp.]
MDITKDAQWNQQGRRGHATGKLVGVAVAILLVAATTAFAANRFGQDQDRDEDHERKAYAIGLWGDLPYSDVQATTGVPNLIADMNRHELAFTAHDGDLKAGNATLNSATPTTCSDALYLQGLHYFNSLKAPAIFTPGDNDWTDCDRPSNGGFSSLERLDHERALFFSTPFSLGQHRIHQEVQTAPLCLGVSGNVPCIENRRWTLGGVTYATLNIQGSCNNLCDTAPSPAEFAARNQADILWMQQTFEEARARDSAAIMLITQADPGFDATDGTRGPVRDPKTLAETDGQPDGFQSFLLALRDHHQLLASDQAQAGRVHGGGELASRVARTIRGLATSSQHRRRDRASDTLLCRPADRFWCETNQQSFRHAKGGSPGHPVATAQGRSGSGRRAASDRVDRAINLGPLHGCIRSPRDVFLPGSSVPGKGLKFISPHLHG